MLKGIDHIVVVVPELEGAIRSYGELGFTVVPGGRHNIGTHNALVAFKDGSYIELIAFSNPVQGHPWYTMLSRGGGLADFCMQTDDISADSDAFRRAGVTVGEPTAMTRDRPDGYRLAWSLTIPNPPFNGSVPFLIKDDTPRDERVPRDREHRNGVAGLATLTVAVEDYRETAEFYRNSLSRPRDTVDQSIDAAGVSFSVGPHQLELLSPRSDKSPLATILKDRGAGPYRATLRGPRSVALDPVHTQRARLAILA